MSDYIVAIDLGTSHITGIVGEKKANGKFSIIAYENVETDSCVHRGIIYSSVNTAAVVGNLLKSLEAHLKGDYIDKVYIGVGGQSLRTIDRIEAMDFEEGKSVMEKDIAALKEQCGKFKPNLADVLGIAPPVYVLDGRKTKEAAGVFCSKLEVHYKLVVGRASIRQNIKNSIEAISGQQLADIIVAPLALADAILSPQYKELGCALVDFGAGVTSVSVYKGGDLLHLCVIPFGGKLITRDLTSLQLTEADAEKLKKEKGSAILLNEDENERVTIEMEGTEREVKLSDLNAIIEARATEIVDNVYARISEVIEPKQLGAGIVLAGCAAELKNLPELLHKKCGVKTGFSTIQKGLVDDSDEMLGNPLYMMAISLMLKGTEPCVSHYDVVADKGNQEGDKADVSVSEEKKHEKVIPKVKEKNKGKELKEKIKDWFDLFGEEA